MSLRHHVSGIGKASVLMCYSYFCQPPIPAGFRYSILGTPGTMRTLSTARRTPIHYNSILMACNHNWMALILSLLIMIGPAGVIHIFSVVYYRSPQRKFLPALSITHSMWWPLVTVEIDFSLMVCAWMRWQSAEYSQSCVTNCLIGWILIQLDLVTHISAIAHSHRNVLWIRSGLVCIAWEMVLAIWGRIHPPPPPPPQFDLNMKSSKSD